MGSLQTDYVAGSVTGISEREMKREQEIVDLMPLVKELAAQIHKKVTKNHDLNDLVSAGMYGLMDAFRRYDHNQETPFRVFAFMRIRGAILDSLRDDDPATRTLRQKSRRIEEAIGKLTSMFGRTPTELEVAEFLDLPLRQYQGLLKEIWQLNILNYDAEVTESIRRSANTPIYDTLPHTDATPHDLLEKKETFTLLLRAIEALPERERKVIALYYYEEMTLKQIGLEIGVVESYVSKIHARALLLLGATLREGNKRKNAQLKVILENKRGRAKPEDRKGPRSIRAVVSAINPIAALRIRATP